MPIPLLFVLKQQLIVLIVCAIALRERSSLVAFGDLPAYYLSNILLYLFFIV